MELNPESAVALASKSRKILMVDDDRVNLRLLGGILRGDGYTLAGASSGEQALDTYAFFHPDLVLLDVMMPGIDGFETCRQLRQIYADRCAPIIFITAKADPDDVVKGLEAGGADYLPKPYKPAEVLARIRLHLQNQVFGEQQKLLVGQLSAANAAKNKFLGMAAHDLRNPLAAILGFSELLSEGSVGPLAAEQLELIGKIHQASEAMLGLVNELLDVAVIDAGELRLRPVPCNLTALVRECASLRNIDATKKKTQIVLHTPPAPPWATVDSAKMRQVVDNLISNAVKYSPPGSIVTVTIQGDGQYCGFSVRDQGPGIPENERDRLFRDFGRLSAKPTGGEQSTGLGLAICRKIVEAHRGIITAENLGGRGCEFRVALPIQAVLAAS